MILSIHVIYLFLSLGSQNLKYLPSILLRECLPTVSLVKNTLVITSNINVLNEKKQKTKNKNVLNVKIGK